MNHELEHDGDEDFDPASDSELPEDFACKHCGRVVLLGPPCCYNNLYGLYYKTLQEVNWLRKIQGKQTKRIQELKRELWKADAIIAVIKVFAIIFLMFVFARN